MFVEGWYVYARDAGLRPKDRLSFRWIEGYRLEVRLVPVWGLQVPKRHRTAMVVDDNSYRRYVTLETCWGNVLLTKRLRNPDVVIVPNWLQEAAIAVDPNTEGILCKVDNAIIASTALKEFDPDEFRCPPSNKLIRYPVVLSTTRV